jgi:hypothetical protein
MAAQDLLHFLLDYECLLFHCDEWWTKNQCSLFLLRLPWIATVLEMLSLAFSRVLPFMTSGEPNRDHHLEQLSFCLLLQKRAYQTVG